MRSFVTNSRHVHPPHPEPVSRYPPSNTSVPVAVHKCCVPQYND